MKFKIFLVLMIFFFIGITLFANQISPNKSNLTHSSNTPTPTPTPMKFRELTVPYLRERAYKSSLGKMNLLETNTTYKTYTTNYTSDGLKVNGLLTEPTGETPAGGWPAIVFVHGYIPPSLYETTGAPYSAYVDYLARNGFVVFKIDLRGHGNSEGKAGGGYYGSDYVVDTLNAYAAL